MIRLFVAIDLPEEVRGRLHALCTGQPGARWQDEHQLHLTLRFIGEVEEPVFARLREELPGAAIPAFPLTLSGLGVFPPRGRPRVVWAGVAPSEELIRLQRRVESRVRAAGLPPEGRRFSPHVTLARLRSTPSGRLRRYLEANGLFTAGPFPVTAYHLYSSVLGRAGALHRIEATCSLEGMAVTPKKS